MSFSHPQIPFARSLQFALMMADYTAINPELSLFSSDDDDSMNIKNSNIARVEEFCYRLYGRSP